MFEILTLNKISESGLAGLKAKGYVCSDDCSSPDAVIVRSASMHETELPASLKAIARAGAGYNNIPVADCTEKGICVFNTPGANANAVKELTICGLLLASRRVAAGVAWCAGLKGEENVAGKIEKGKSAFAGPEISGKTLGVYGLGAIGILVANQAAALGMKVVGYDPYLSDKAAAELATSVTVVADLDKLFAQADYITLHAPLNDSTKDTICAASFAKCKDGVRVVNFARGGLVNTADMLAALESGKCAAYVTDFPSEEMIGAEGVTAIPHLGASTTESEENCAVMAAEQVALYLETGSVKNSVNLPCITKAPAGGPRYTVIIRGDAETAVEALISAGVSLRDSVCGDRNGISYFIIDGEDTAFAAQSAEGVIAVRTIA